MTVQYAGDAIVMGANDFITKTDGVTWGIKSRNIAGFQTIFVVEFYGNAWQSVHTLESEFDVHFKNYDNIFDYIKAVIIPALNSWLAKKFGNNTSLTPFEQVDAALLGIKITKTADGSYVASI